MKCLIAVWRLQLHAPITLNFYITNPSKAYESSRHNGRLIYLRGPRLLGPPAARHLAACTCDQAARPK